MIELLYTVIGRRLKGRLSKARKIAPQKSRKIISQITALSTSSDPPITLHNLRSGVFMVYGTNRREERGKVRDRQRQFLGNLFLRLSISCRHRDHPWPLNP